MKRQFLVTKFVCSKCGLNLELTYDPPKGAGRRAEGEPTGAAMVQQVVAIEPCQCVTSQLENIRTAARTLITAAS